MLKQPIYYEFNLDARTSPSKLIAISHVDDKYSEVLEVAVKQNDRFVYMGGATVIARMVLHRDKDYLLSDDVTCSVNANGNILIPFDNAVVKTSQGVVKIEVSISHDADRLTLQFPLWVSVNGSILDDAEVTPESQGTIPELLKEVKEELARVKDFATEEFVFENLDAALQGNPNTAPSLFVMQDAETGSYKLVYMDSADNLHVLFDFGQLPAAATGAQVFIGDTEPSDPNIVLWVDTSSGEPTPGTTDPVTNLLGFPTSNSVILSWTASANASSYKIYLGDTFVDSTASVTYTVTGLAPETEYTLGVVATGVGGNSTKVTITVTTQAGGGGDLPSDYQQVAYVVAPADQGLGGLYSGLKNNEIAKVQIGFEADWSQYQMLWYSANADNTVRGEPYVFNTLEKTKVTASGYTTSNVTASPSEYVGETVNVDFTIELRSSNEKYIFFGGAEPTAWAGSDRKIYYIRVFDSSNILLRNYIPCYRKSDNKVGMYDLIQREFVIPQRPWNKGGNV